jgi:hypothetical protein
MVIKYFFSSGIIGDFLLIGIGVLYNTPFLIVLGGFLGYLNTMGYQRSK